MATDTTRCICCGNDRPTVTQFSVTQGALSAICIHCETLDNNQAAIKTLETATILHRLATQTRDGRKHARVERRREAYAVLGKRCSACHYSKPVAEYGACAPAGDGLQSVCKICSKTRLTLCTYPGGRAAWLTYRDAMRAKAKVTQTTA